MKTHYGIHKIFNFNNNSDIRKSEYEIENELKVIVV